MISKHKTAIIAILTAAVITGLYEAHQASRLQEENQFLQEQQVALAQQIQQLEQERDDITNRLNSMAIENGNNFTNVSELLTLRGEVTRLRKDKRDIAGSEAVLWEERVKLLKQHLEQTPEAKIPELRFLTERDWLDVVKDHDLKNEMEFRQAFSQLRFLAESNVGHQMQKAMKKYSDANQGNYPSDFSLLKPYLDSPLEDSILQRYAISPSASVKNINMGGEWTIILKEPVDAEFDMQLGIGLYGVAAVNFSSLPVVKALTPALEAYKAANNGKDPDNTLQLAPYLTTPEQQTAFQTAIKQENGK